MQYLDSIANFFGDLTAASSSAALYCRSVPILGGPLRDFFSAGASIFRDIRTMFSYASDAWDDMDFKISDFLSWDGIKGLIEETWGFLGDIAAVIYDGVHNIILDQYSEITDFWGNVAVGVGDVIADQYSEITDFWGNVAEGIGDWFSESLPDWAEDRAEDIVNLAGRILDKVW